MKLGNAWLVKNTLHIDSAGWKLIKAVAKKLHRTPKQIVIAGLKRGHKRAQAEAKKRMESSQVSRIRRP
jgi:hypothetical protein